MLNGIAIERVLCGISGSAHRRKTCMVDEYRRGIQEAETNVIRDQKTQIYTRRQANLVTLPCIHCVPRLEGVAQYLC
jgi:hypothetical protein